ncbi:hypothetical protein LguiB_022117 [Lonicera macranthoides]
MENWDECLIGEPGKLKIFDPSAGTKFTSFPTGDRYHITMRHEKPNSTKETKPPIFCRT